MRIALLGTRVGAIWPGLLVELLLLAGRLSAIRSRILESGGCRLVGLRIGAVGLGLLMGRRDAELLTAAGGHLCSDGRICAGAYLKRLSGIASLLLLDRRSIWLRNSGLGRLLELLLLLMGRELPVPVVGRSRHGGDAANEQKRVAERSKAEVSDGRALLGRGANRVPRAGFDRKGESVVRIER